MKRPVVGRAVRLKTATSRDAAVWMFDALVALHTEAEKLGDRGLRSAARKAGRAMEEYLTRMGW